jgi:hypothetical protein
MGKPGDMDEEGFTLVVRKDKRYREKIRDDAYGLEKMQELAHRLERAAWVYLQMNTALNGVDIRFSDIGVNCGHRPLIRFQFNATPKVTALEDRQWFLDDPRRGPENKTTVVDPLYWAERLFERVVWIRVATEFYGLEMYDHIPSRKRGQTGNRPVGVMKMEGGSIKLMLDQIEE